MLELFRPIFTNLWYVVLIAFFFGGTIFVHELGHFLAARRRGLKVDRFSIGFGPKIFSWTRNGVEYRLSWIPLGGYVALPQLADMRGIEGEPSTDTQKLPAISYTDKMIVSVMGAVFNLIFAFLLACLLWVIKQPVRADQSTTTIGYVNPTVDLPAPNNTVRAVPSPALEAGLQVGDRVVSIDGEEVRDWEDLHYAIVTGKRYASNDRRRSDFIVDRTGELLPITVHPLLTGEEDVRQVGIAPDYDVIVDAVPPGSLAERVGLRAKDVLVSINATAIRNEMTYAEQLAKNIHESLVLVVRRDAELVTLSVPPRSGIMLVDVAPESPAAALGLKAHDVVTSLDGEPLRDRAEFVTKLRLNPQASFQLGVQRGAHSFVVTVPPRPFDGGRLGVELAFTLGERLTLTDELVRLNPFEQFKRVVNTTISTLATLVDPRSDIGLSKMSGPVGIIRIYYYAVRAELRFVLWLTLVVNINLAIFNLLPIPVLDGGHMLFATISKLRGRALSPNFLMTTQSVFMALLLTMVVYVSFFDVRRTWRDWFGRDQPVRHQTPPADPTPEPAPPAPVAP